MFLFFLFGFFCVSKWRRTVRFDQHLLLAHVLDVDRAVNDELGRGTVVVDPLTLVALDLEAVACYVTHKQVADLNLTDIQEEPLNPPSC